jgi:DNA-3-methyladenine glycosylase II
MTQLRVPLPAGYRTADVLAFYARDVEGVAEQVREDGFSKGVTLHGVPVRFDVVFSLDTAQCTLTAAGRQHTSGLWCYPEAADVAALDVTALTSRKFSRSKADTLLRLAQLVVSGTLSLARDVPLADVSAQLLAIKGIGPWTVNYALLRGYGYADCSLQGDVAVRTALQRLLGADMKPDIAATEAWLAQYAPYRTMVAAYLWDSLAEPA